MGVVIEGLDENYRPQTETVTHGTTAVTTDNTFVRVFRMSTDASTSRYNRESYKC